MKNNSIYKLMKLVSAVREEVATICGFTDAQLLRATLCAESKGEPLQGQQGVLNVILNRAGTYHGVSNPRTANPIYQGSSRVSIAILRKLQFSCWNGTSTCESFKNAYAKAIAGCTINLTTADYSVFEGATLEEAKKIFHYINPKTSTSKEWWVQQVKTQSNAHTTDTSWTAQLPTKMGVSTLVTWRFWRIGAHVFVSGPAL